MIMVSLLKLLNELESKSLLYKFDQNLVNATIASTINDPNNSSLAQNVSKRPEVRFLLW